MPSVIFDAASPASSLTRTRASPNGALTTRLQLRSRGAGVEEVRHDAPIDATLVDELHHNNSHARLTGALLARRALVCGLVTERSRAHIPRGCRARLRRHAIPARMWCERSREQRQMLRGGIFLSRVGATVPRAGLVSVSFVALSGAPGLPSASARWPVRERRPFSRTWLGEVQKLPPETGRRCRNTWVASKSFRGMWRTWRRCPRAAPT